MDELKDLLRNLYKETQVIGEEELSKRCEVFGEELVRHHGISVPPEVWRKIILEAKKGILFRSIFGSIVCSCFQRY